MKIKTSHYDYIVVGGGSSGCTVAGLLAERTSKKVLLIEAGANDKNKFIHMPGGFPEIIDRFTWGYVSEAQAQVSDRKISIPQGYVLGGGSSVNGELYVRGQPQDYDQWETDYGCVGWGYKDVLPYFIKSECNQSLHDTYHGVSGHLKVSDSVYRHPLSYAIVQAGQELGYTYVNDFNGAAQGGVGFYQTTTYKGKRCSAAVAYLEKVRGNHNLDIATQTFVQRLLIDGDQVQGVELVDANGNRQHVYADVETVLCAGAIGTPKLLMLSGIGPAEHLKAVGITPLLDASQVGKNFQDHLHLSVVGLLREPISLLGQDKGIKALGHGLQWALFKNGLLSSNLLECGGFFDTGAEGRPDVQLMSLAIIDNVDDKSSSKVEEHGVSLKVAQLNTRSRGEVLLRDNDPQSLPLIQPNYLSDPQDLETLVRGVKLGLEFFGAPALASRVKKVILPDENQRTDEQLRDFIREYAKTVYHPVGTCRMGPSAQSSVVDLELRVHGIKKLRVADASVFPMIPRGNTNAPTIMVAEKAVDMLLA